LALVSSDLGTILATNSLFLFQSPNASADTEDLGPFLVELFVVTGKSSM
jgi:hypothetical protein